MIDALMIDALFIVLIFFLGLGSACAIMHKQISRLRQRYFDHDAQLYYIRKEFSTVYNKIKEQELRQHTILNGEKPIPKEVIEFAQSLRRKQ